MYINAHWLEIIDPDTGEVIRPGGNVNLSTVKAPSLTPQTADMSAATLPVNEYTVDVITDQDIPWDEAGVMLYDDRAQLWCAWPVSKAQRISDTCVRITATSWLWRLKYRELEPEMYVNKSASAAIADVFGQGHANDYELNSSLSNRQLNGFVPAQTALERLAWILFILGAYVSDIYRTNALITVVDDTETLIPLQHTFARPTVNRAEWVTGLKITTYTFRQAATEEEWMEDDSSYMFPLPWLATEQTVTLDNPGAPSDAQPHVIEINGIYLISPNNVSDITARLVKYWFNPTEVTLDVINNRSYKPGDLVTVYTDTEQIATGYIQQVGFAFGLQARSTLKLVGAAEVSGAKLTINYTYEGGRIAQATYFLPVGSSYSISNPYIDRTYQDRRYIYRPQDAAVTGTIIDSDNTVTQPCDVALEYRDERLYVYSVDAIVKQGDSGIYTGVIS